MSVNLSKTVIQVETEQVQEQLSQWIKNDRRRIRIFAELIMAIPLSRSVQGNDLAENIIRDVQDQSIQQMLRRFYKNPAITWEAFYLPLLQAALGRLRLPVYELVMDTTQVGAEHRAVVLSLTYHNRSLPLVWTVEAGSKGHSKEAVQVALLKQLAAHIAFPGPVIFLGDTEFDGVEVQEQLRTLGWYYVLRTSPTLYIYPAQGDGLPLADLAPSVGCPPQSRLNVRLTTKHQFGPVNVFTCWESPYDEPLLLTYHLPSTWPASVRTTYEHRFWTEPLFGDCKEAGFRLTQTQLEHADRLSRLFLAVSASYLWMVSLGVQTIVDQTADLVDRSKRRTLSIFKTGWRSFKRHLKLGLFVPFHLTLSSSFVLPPLTFIQT
jgi:hypothetical protein